MCDVECGLNLRISYKSMIKSLKENENYVNRVIKICIYIYTYMDTYNGLNSIALIIYCNHRIIMCASCAHLPTHYTQSSDKHEHTIVCARPRSG